jgi:DNA repair exonuclease SbcCD ATPase subunit
VLLLQGKAEKLLDSKPEGRREVLASIVDLGRYERLHQKADERRKSLDMALKLLEARLNAIPEVQPLEMAEAKERIGLAEQARAGVRAEIERLQKLEYEARVWHDLQQRLGQSRQRWQRAQEVLSDAAAIEQAVARLRELREVLPKLHEITVFRGQASQADEMLVKLGSLKQRQTELLTEKESALRQARDKRQTVENQITRDETKHREVAKRLGNSAIALNTLKECERQEHDLEQIRNDLKELPADPAGELAHAREAFDRLDALARLVPQLLRFRTKRDELNGAVEQVRTTEQEQQKVRAHGEERKRELERLKPLVEEAAARLNQASEQATEARTLFAQARESLQELTHLEGSKVCRHCGQALTPGHIEEEKSRRGTAMKVAEARARQTADALEAARKAEQQLREQLTAADKAYQEARVAYGEGNAHIKQAKLAGERLQEECATLYAEIPEPFRGKISPAPVADWLKTTYPTAQDTDALKVQARGVEAARRQKQKAEEDQQNWAKLKAQETTVQEMLHRLQRELPANRQALRQQHQELVAQQDALYKSVDAGREQKAEIDREVKRLEMERDLAKTNIGQTEGKIKEQELIRDNARRGMASLIKVLPPAWQPRAETIGLREHHDLKMEQNELEQKCTDDRARELEQARHGLEVMRQEVAQLEAQQEKYPPEARQEVSVIAGLLREARKQDATCDEKLGEAKHQFARLEGYLRQRAEIAEEMRQQQKEWQTYKLLADLLGRERLQLYLVRQAERQVVEYANAVLDRLSGGQLYLKLAGEANGEGGSDKALDLEAYNRATGERPINVAFLSGSQKFRVAVSLALGIGQYASRQHRPIESVIIDEGFGCLDSQGRQVMIQELQNLRSQMRCILLVSHQEDFAESFSDGYQFRLENGATKVARIRK